MTILSNDIVTLSRRDASNSNNGATFGGTRLYGTTAAGSFNVTSASISGTTNEAPVYNFVVIKGTII